MKDWKESFEVEKRKLNELGHKTFEQGVPLFKNNALQAQSRKVDELIIQLHKRVGYKRRSS
ncbi:aspartyl-phosphate phosphatase Spo0E family protein [Paenibacillus lentus]|uniref:aspartyl-phosphate phosphatase Spo0E family protein n=1 Tax=Paenibacillus lentus TaxID=1338368 RepID=UPI00366A4715